jgi:hypothetical protein
MYVREEGAFVTSEIPKKPTILDLSFFVVLPAQRSIARVAAKLHLLALSHDLSVPDPGIEVSPLAAPADLLDLLYIVRKLHKPLCAGKKMTLKVSP